MGRFHGWMDNMGRCIPWVDAIFHSDQKVTHSSFLAYNKTVVEYNLKDFCKFSKVKRVLCWALMLVGGIWRIQMKI